MAAIELDGVSKSYGTVQVMARIDLSIQDGEFVVLVGPSGCGKSTLLRMIAGLEAINGGELRIDGAVVNDLPPKDRDIAMVFQSYALYPHKTVAQNMGFALKMRGTSPGEIDQRVRASAVTLNLTPYLDRYPRQLSGGQRQRVAMGRAIVRDPKVFLFDEPLSNLDAQLRVQMRAEIKELQRRLGATMVYVTHDQVEAMTMADRIVVMRAGHVEQMGSPLELFDRPTNLFVATFIGSPPMNLLHGSVQGGRFVGRDGAMIAKVRSTPDGDNLILGVRPDAFEIGGDVPLRVRLTEPNGNETQVIGHIGEAPIICSFKQRVTAIAGETIMVRTAEGSSHLFQEESGVAIGHGL